MNYKVTDRTEDSFTVWDGKTMHPDYPGKPMGETTFFNSQGHRFQIGDIVQIHVRLMASAKTEDNQDRLAIDRRLAEGAGKRASDQ